MSRNETIKRIARDILGVEILDTRNSDSLDFHDLPVWEIKRALEAAYLAGATAAAEKARAP
jgi:hypothetical protein